MNSRIKELGGEERFWEEKKIDWSSVVGGWKDVAESRVLAS